MFDRGELRNVLLKQYYYFYSTFSARAKISKVVVTWS